MNLVIHCKETLQTQREQGGLISFFLFFLNNTIYWIQTAYNEFVFTAFQNKPAVRYLYSCIKHIFKLNFAIVYFFSIYKTPKASIGCY